MREVRWSRQWERITQNLLFRIFQMRLVLKGPALGVQERLLFKRFFFYFKTKNLLNYENSIRKINTY